MGELSPPCPLADRHDVSRFDCGKDALNDWIRTKAAKSEGRSARCYVVCEGNVVVGYYALATGAVMHDGSGRVPRALRANLPNPTPAMVLARLAVDNAWQGRGLGKALLRDALARTLAASRIVGARALIVHAIDDEAVKFYAGFGFRSFPDEPRTLFLAMETIAKAV
jgi:GNAT superfamily N-acetyltransferase